MDARRRRIRSPARECRTDQTTAALTSAGPQPPRHRLATPGGRELRITPVPHATAGVYDTPMEGVTTALVGFILLAFAFPSLIRNRTMFYAALTTVVVIILLWSAGEMVGPREGEAVHPFTRFTVVFGGLLQAVSLILLLLSSGGLSAKELAGEIAGAYEVIRRGEDEKEVIVPIGGVRHGDTRRPASGGPEAPAPQRFDITGDIGPGELRKKPPEGGGSIPLE